MGDPVRGYGKPPSRPGSVSLRRITHHWPTLRRITRHSSAARHLEGFLTLAWHFQGPATSLKAPALPARQDAPRTHPHYITVHYITLHHSTLHYTTLLHITSYHITPHYIQLHHITSHHITLQYNTLHYIPLHHITSHHITLHYIALHYITLHHITFLCAALGPAMRSLCTWECVLSAGVCERGRGVQSRLSWVGTDRQTGRNDQGSSDHNGSILSSGV
jgi:hypothetical protein